MMISLKDVVKTYAPNKELAVTAINGVSLDVERGEFLVIIGRSGSGKTTLLNLVAGLTKPTSGEVLLESVNLWSLGDREQSLLRNQKIGFIFQFPSLLPSLTALENVALPTSFGPESKKDGAYARASHLLETVGLTDKLNAYPRQLSAGQQQRVVIARSLMNQPEILLADEATSNLDEETEKEIMALFQKIHASTGVTILMVAHSTYLADYATRSIRMANGAISASSKVTGSGTVYSSPPTTVVTAPAPVLPPPPEKLTTGSGTVYSSPPTTVATAPASVPLPPPEKLTTRAGKRRIRS
jgi:putative ABC transport system ATP-binding protein/lipoprotein-releasing system ATP-binding protein